MPRLAADVASRVGIRDRDTIRRYVEAAVADGFIAAVRNGSQWIVSRPGRDLGSYGLSTVKTSPSKRRRQNVATTLDLWDSRDLWQKSIRSRPLVTGVRWRGRARRQDR
jgi:hypothetical protein